MAKSNDETLTKYTVGTIVTSDIANSLFGGLYGSAEGDILETDDVRVVGHVHDGAHVDGHAQKVDLVEHVTGKLENTNLADQAVMKNNVYRTENQTEAIPWYEVSDGKTLYYLNLSSVTLDAVATSGNTTDQSITIGSDSESPVGKLDLHHVGEAIDDSDMDQFAINIVNGRELLDFGGVQEYSDASSGYTLVTTNSDHGLVTGDCVVINNTTNYDGIYNVTKMGDKSFKIAFPYAAESVVGDEQFRQLVSETGIGFRVSTDTSDVSPGAAITHKRFVTGTTHTDTSIGSLNFKTKASSSAKDLDTRMTIDRNGLVGIGTTSPTNTLHLEEVGDGPCIALELNDGTISAGEELGCVTFGGTLDGGATYNGNAVVIRALAEGAWSNVASDAGGYLEFMTTSDGSASTTTKMIIKGDGKVGIGTTGPGKQLEINSVDGNNLRLTHNDADGSAGNYADFTLTSSGDLTINASGGDMTLGMGIQSSVTVSGNLIVNGATTTINSTTLTVDDPLIYLGGDAAPGAADNKDRGIAFRWWDSAAEIGFMGWDHSAEAIRFGRDVTITSEVVSFVIPAAVDLQGAELILDADGNTSITADTDNQIDIKIAGADDFQFTANKFLVQTGSSIDLNGTELILDADADTSITADTDDQIDIRINGADKFRITADALYSTVAKGSYLKSAAGTPALPTFSFYGDTNTGMYSDTDDELAFSTAGTKRMVIMDDGRVGINTNDPAAGTQLACANGTNEAVIAITTYSDTPANGAVLKLRSSNDDTIGTNANSQDGDTVGRINFELNDGNSFDESCSIRGIVDQSSNAREGYDGGRLSFYTTDQSENATPAERMTIRNDGKVGIGTSNPASIFSIAKAGTGVFPVSTITAYNAGTSGPEIRFRHSRHATSGSHTHLNENDSLGSIVFKASDEAASTFRIGAKILCEASAVHVPHASNWQVPSDLKFYTAPNTNGVDAQHRMTLTDEGRLSLSDTGTVGDPGSTYGLRVDRNAASGYVAGFFNDGNNVNRYGILIQCGEDSISGETRYVECLDGNGGLSGRLQDAAGTVSFADTSDRRLKKDICDTELDGLSAVNSMRVRDFTWKKSGVSTTGFIAQELEEAFPIAVSGDESGDEIIDPMMVMRDTLVIPLVKAVQELSAEVNELKTKLAEYSNSNGN